MGGNEQDELGVGVIGTRPVVRLPDGVAEPRPGRADVGVAVVAVHAPRLQDALDVALVAGPADVVDDLVAPAFLQRAADARGDQLQRLVPADLLPLPLAALADAPQRVQDAVGVVDLIERRRPLGAQPAATGRVDRVALELADGLRFLVHVGDESARRLAVEAGRWHQLVVSFDTPAGPAAGLDFDPVVPLVRRRRVGDGRGGVALRLRRGLGKYAEADGEGFDPADVL